MPTDPLFSNAGTARRWLGVAAALVGLAPTAARCEADPYVIGVSETISHDSNVVHLPDGASQPPKLYSITDWIATTALFGNVDQPIGRQRLYGNASVRNNHYRYNSVYSNLAYGLSAGLDWATVERVSGTLSLSSNRSLASFDRSGTNTPELAKNIERTDQFGLTGRVGVVTDLTVEAGYNHQSQRFSEVGAKLVQHNTNLGLRYRLGGELTLGGGLRFTNGSYPDNNDSFKGRDVSLSADYSPSPISFLAARLSLSRTDHSAATAQDFSGATGALVWSWKPTGKLVFDTRLYRVTGTESSFNANAGGFFGPVTAQGDNSRLTTTFILNTTYEATAKIQLSAGYSRAARKLTNSLALNAAQPATVTDADRLTRLSLGARYQPTRNVQFDCNIGRESRSADTSQLSSTYASNTVGCAAQFAVQP